MRELILAALEEPLDYDEAGRGGLIAHLILAELGRMQERPMQLPMPRDPRAIRVARALAVAAGCRRRPRRLGRTRGASRRTLARLFRVQTGFSFNEWRARLRAIDGLARLSNGDPVGTVASAVGYASPSAFTAMVRTKFRRSAEADDH